MVNLITTFQVDSKSLHFPMLQAEVKVALQCAEKCDEGLNILCAAVLAGASGGVILGTQAVETNIP